MSHVQVNTCPKCGAPIYNRPMSRDDALRLLRAKLELSSAEAGRLKVISNYLTEAVRRVGAGVSPDVVFVELEQKGIVC